MDRKVKTAQDMFEAEEPLQAYGVVSLPLDRLSACYRTERSHSGTPQRPPEGENSLNHEHSMYTKL